jgi:hypothetical protein
MKKTINTFVCFLALSSIALAEPSQKTFFYGEHYLNNTSEPSRQAESWALCSASYDLSSQLYDEDSAVGKQLSQMANGAEVAIMMSHILSLDSENTTTESFSSNISYGKTLMSELPLTKRTSILAQFEIASDEEKGALVEQLANTTKVCAENSKLQQSYIDMYRDMVRQGLLVIPKD